MLAKNNNKENQISVLVPDGEKQLALKVVNSLSAVQNVDIHVLSKHKWVELRFSHKIKSFQSYSSDCSEEELMAIIASTTEDKAIDVILPIHVEFTRLLSKHRCFFKTLGIQLLLPNVDALDRANCKWRLYQILEKESINAPLTLHTDQCKNGSLSIFSFPVLYKPLSGMGGVGIIKAKSEHELINVLGQEREGIVQNFVDGYDIDMSVLCSKGRILAYTIQKGFLAWNNPYQPFLGLDFLYEEKIHTMITQLMASLEWDGVAHIDLRFDAEENKFKVIEINPRFWGSIEASEKVGVNFPYLYCLSSIGRSFEVPAYRKEKYVNNRGLLKLLLNHPFKVLPRNSSIYRDLKDPLPKVYKYSIKTMKKILPKKSNLLKKFKYEVI